MKCIDQMPVPIENAPPTTHGPLPGETRSAVVRIAQALGEAQRDGDASTATT